MTRPLPLPRAAALAPTLLVAAWACSGDGTTPTGDAEVDLDADGFASGADCDDSDPHVHPGAIEGCNGLDDDCDGEVDEGFDVDGDGSLDRLRCATGGDCDDSDPERAPTATDEPYDGVDQDCDGADLTDVDADGFDATAAGGGDCDDDDPSIHPGAFDTPFDGIDQDCDGGDSKDGDGDGHEAAGSGGSDCDDDDPTVHPGSLDLAGDGVDRDCDGADGGTRALADVEVSMQAPAGVGIGFGYSVAICDLDEDGRDDLVVGTPFAAGNLGALLVWYGAGSEDWHPGMNADYADSVLIDPIGFMGVRVACTDVDGDGHVDVVASRADYASAEWTTTWALAIYQGDGGRWPELSTERTPDAELQLALGSEGPDSGAVSAPWWALDVDGDGLDELVVDTRTGSGYTGGDDRLVALPSERYAGPTDLLTVDGLWAVEEHPIRSVTHVRPLPPDDSHGPGVLLAAGWTRYATGDGGVVSSGRLGVGAWDPEATSTDDLAEVWLVGRDDMRFGWDAAAADFDGDGRVDLAGAAVTEEVDGESVGVLRSWRDIHASGTTYATSSEGALVGARDGGQLGIELLATGDWDGDGIMELVVAENRGGEDGLGRVHLLSGPDVFSDGEVAEAAMASWSGEDEDGNTGVNLATGDLDGDGLPDLAVSNICWSSTDADLCEGKVYVELSSRR